MEKEYSVILLAAGESSRLGRPKQALGYRGGTLLHYMVKTALALKSGPVIVVLGSGAEQFISDCKGATPVINKNWQDGMAGSICCGLDTLIKKSPSVQGTIIAVIDQPYVTTALFQQLIDEYRSSQLPIIACTYNQVIGTPVFFEHSIFPELMQLKGDRGAKMILQKARERVGLINFPHGSEDIDTEEDYARLVKTDLK